MYKNVSCRILPELMKSLREGVLILNHLNIIEQANDAALNILGIAPPATLAGTHISQVRSDCPALTALFTSLADGENTNGYSREVFYTIRAFREEPKGDPVTIIVLHDIKSGKKAAQTIAAHTKSLEKSNVELDQFAHMVSHDLKAPLRAISNLSLWLEEDLGSSLSGENRDNFAKLRSRVVRMESLINGILAYSKVGQEQMANEPIDAYGLVAEVVELLAPPSHIKVAISSDMPALEAPKVMLLQVFSNLISNAIKYNDKKDGLISVHGQEKETCFEFTVEDNGPGIPAEYHDKIFVIFQTLQSRDKFESTGIGLTIVKRILAARGGEIRVISAPRQGSKFIFTWPK